MTHIDINAPKSQRTEYETVDLTQADLDRGLTPEQIAREKADLNWAGFMRDMKPVFKDAAAKADRKQAKHE